MKQTIALLAPLLALLAATGLPAAAQSTRILHVSPTGDDANPGTVAEPLATLAAAQRAARASAGREAVTVWLHGGVYYLPETIRFTAADSGTAAAPVLFAAAPGEQPIISGGVRLALEWMTFRDGILQAKTPTGIMIDQLFVNGQRQHMARYPNYDPKAAQFNGAAADAIAPERIARWSDPAGGTIHAMHPSLWGDMHWRILGKKPDGSLDYEGGWQNNRPSGMHKKFRMVENIREELDAPGEWFHDATDGTLYFFPPADVNLRTATVEAVRLRHLMEFNGTREHPVKFITLRGLTFRHAARTFMENREPVLRSDWTIYRGGAVVFNGAEDATVADCDFDQVGGSAVFVNNYNRRIAVRGCLIRESGANGVAFVGDPKAVRSPLFNYAEEFDYAKIDRTPGPRSDGFPADCLVEDCLITRSGRFEKQTAPVEIDMAQTITVRHCSIYDVPRAGINIGDGCWGGHIVEHCDIFETVLETGDHGSFNSWGRDRYWHRDARVVEKEVAADPSLPHLDAIRPNILRHNRWRCDHGWDVDLDDGSSYYEIYNNLFLNGGLKLREGYGRTVTNNVIVNNSLHPHVWYENSGDVFARNIVMGAYRPARMEISKWGQTVDRNFFVTGVQLAPGQFGAWGAPPRETGFVTSDADRTKFADKGCDANSQSGDALFVDAATGDFRVKDGSPALRLGFVNFPMNNFGVRSPRLKAVARVPAIPSVKLGGAEAAPVAAVHAKWAGATLRDLGGQEYSALGVAADTGGAWVAEAPKDSGAYAAGLRTDDLILRVNTQAVRNVAELLALMTGLAPAVDLTLEIVRQQSFVTLKSNAVVFQPMEVLPVPIAEGPVLPTWSSLGDHFKTPTWWRNAKIGMWLHWGPQSVGESGDWYARFMYMPQGKFWDNFAQTYPNHLKRFGHPSEFGYKDILRLWKAEKWDPEKLMALYKRAGARYVIGQGMHHDNFDLWDSRYQPWNSVRLGPERDILGGWRNAARKEGLRFGIAFHGDYSLWWMQPVFLSDPDGTLKGVPYDGAQNYAGKDTWWKRMGLDLKDLYGIDLKDDVVYPAGFTGDPIQFRMIDNSNGIQDGGLKKNIDFARWYATKWTRRVIDAIDQHHPDFIYFDGGYPFSGYRTGRGIRADALPRVIAHLYNSSIRRNGGNLEAMAFTKGNEDPRAVAVNFESKFPSGIKRDQPWQTEVGVGEWFYAKGTFYDSGMVIHQMLEAVSRDGNYAINLPLTPAGELDPGGLKTLRDMGEWMDANSEGIHDSSAWDVWGEGSVVMQAGNLGPKQAHTPYTAKDIRFTSKAGAVYAYLMAWPGDGKAVIRSLATPSGKVTGVELLGSKLELAWAQTDQGLEILLSGKKPGEFAFGLKVKGENLRAAQFVK
ncbi:MAG: alpha-L-fucosidase [Opitutaceae bacterium]|nr:alpha-L-fucosidase [Opitutaceae bacterium]